MSDAEKKKRVTVLWFRRGLRLHDNPALLEAINHCDEFYPIFIYDGQTAGTSKDVGYNRLRFLLESLEDLDSQFRALGGKLNFVCGNPCDIFQALHNRIGIDKICYEYETEPAAQSRDESVKSCLCQLGIEYVEKISHTLWDPNVILETNGNIPPLTYQMFLHTASVVGLPPRPVCDPNWNGVSFGVVPQDLCNGSEVLDCIPSPEKLGVLPVKETKERMVHWIGGEKQALKKMEERLKLEKEVFLSGYYLPNQTRPDLLAAPTSQSAALSCGCLSVRKFYWAVHDTFNEIYGGQPASSQHITGQLIWREFFYTMSLRNPYFGEMERNPICINIPWGTDDDLFYKWENGKTGYPFIDAVMRQLHQEGWVHHVARNAVACFLTRGDLWLNWERGLQLFVRLLLDADWAVCSGNWMWVSSSAFEQLLDCSDCVCPVNYGRRLDPHGEYIKRYIPELRRFPVEYLYEPWKASLKVQENAGCIIGRDYPERVVDHQKASQKNQKLMKEIRDGLISSTPHCCPSNEDEVRQFMWLPESCADHLCLSSDG